jgi:ATP-binding cassette subfamily F protein 3
MINITNLSLYYGERALFSDVSFTIQPSDRIGLVGRNGAGKSTLMKIIAGHITTFKGSVDRPSGSTLGFLHQDINTPKGKTVMEEALSAFEEVRTLEKKIDAINGELEVRTDYESEGYEKLLHDLSDATDRMTHLGGYTIHADTQRILTGLGFKPTDMDRLTDEFSGGWQMRIELAKMLLQKPDFLLLDEPTNHLDIESIIWLEEFLVTYEGAVMVISHDKMFLDNVTKRTIEIELGNVYDYKANYTEYKVMRAERRGLQKNAFDNPAATDSTNTATDRPF